MQRIKIYYLIEYQMINTEAKMINFRLAKVEHQLYQTLPTIIPSLAKVYRNSIIKIKSQAKYICRAIIEII
jgi:hypothetical protein